MNIELVREYCLVKKGVTEGFPFGEGVLVFKVLGKMFATLSLNVPSSMNLKCEPEYALDLRDQYNAIKPGYHMNKKHWNTLALVDEDFTPELLWQLIDHSYELVVKGLKKADREKLKITI